MSEPTIKMQTTTYLPCPVCSQPAPADTVLRHKERHLFDISVQERHAVEHARYKANCATPENPDCCFDYELVNSLIWIIDRFALTRPQRETDSEGQS